MNLPTLLPLIVVLLLTACATGHMEQVKVQIAAAPLDAAANEPVDPASLPADHKLNAEPSPSESTVVAEPAAVSSGVRFNLHSEPVLTKDAVADWPAHFLGLGATIHHNGLFHLFFNASDGWPSINQVGYATSVDGLTWTLVSEEPVFSAAGVEYMDFTLNVDSVVVEDDGTWALYYTIIPEQFRGGSQAFGRATATDPAGPWMADPAPIFAVGAEGSWDGGFINTPHVIRTDEGYVMYYAGNDAVQTGTTFFGLATSDDGVNWIRYNDPETTEPLLTYGDPVFSLNPGREMLGPAISSPSVQATDDGWFMAFRVRDALTGYFSINYAFSRDGLNWEAVNDLDPFTTERTDWYRIYTVSLLNREGTLYTLFDTQPGELYETDIQVATYDGPLP